MKALEHEQTEALEKREAEAGCLIPYPVVESSNRCTMVPADEWCFANLPNIR